MAELRASRKRIVEAADGERRRLERNIHDGAQQQLVALSVMARLAETTVDSDKDRRPGHGRPGPGRRRRRAGEPPGSRPRDLPAAAGRAGAGGGAGGAGPQGPASRSRWKRTGSGATRRRPRPPCTSARWRRCRTWRSTPAASRAAVRPGRGQMPAATAPWSSRSPTTGPASIPASAGYGTGLQGMADRLAALGGDLQVRSEPGHGTTVTGRLPARRAGAGAVTERSAAAVLAGHAARGARAPPRCRLHAAGQSQPAAGEHLQPVLRRGVHRLRGRLHDRRDADRRRGSGAT